MTKNKFTPVLLSITALLWACSSTPTGTPLLEQARTNYTQATNNPDATKYAPLELKQAGDALEKANIASNKQEGPAVVDGLAYIASQKIALVHVAASQKSTEAGMANSSKDRDQMRLEQRTKEADQAKSAMNAAQQETQLAKKDSSALMLELADLKAKETERGIVVTFSDVLFATDVAKLNATGTSTATKLAGVLQKNPQRTVLVEGFTDSTGPEAHNQKLSLQRANSVADALRQSGISTQRVAIRAYGETNPAAPNDSSKNRQLNRRVEIVISDENGRISPR
jgi:outer membrane protein OmpA-like peptidoglycan-associated protein